VTDCDSSDDATDDYEWDQKSGKKNDQDEVERMTQDGDSLQRQDDACQNERFVIFKEEKDEDEDYYYYVIKTKGQNRPLKCQ